MKSCTSNYTSPAVQKKAIKYISGGLSLLSIYPRFFVRRTLLITSTSSHSRKNKKVFVYIFSLSNCKNPQDLSSVVHLFPGCSDCEIRFPLMFFLALSALDDLTLNSYQEVAISHACIFLAYLERKKSVGGDIEGVPCVLITPYKM